MMYQAFEHHQAGRLARAEELYRQVLRLDPHQADALNLLGTIAIQTRQPEAAIDYIRRALAMVPTEPEYHATMAAAAQAAGEVRAAIHHYREALRLKPAALGLQAHLGDALLEAGSLDEGLQVCLDVLRQDPDSALAWCVLGELVGARKHRFSPADLHHMQQLLADGKLGDHEASQVWFTLAAEWERQEAFDEAFRCYRRANELKAAVYRQSQQAFHPGRHRELIDRLLAFFTPEFFARTRHYGADSEMPIFVVGMVRSGTSLVEQILSSHPQVYGAGELKDMDQLSTTLPERLGSIAQPFPMAAPMATPTHVAAGQGNSPATYPFCLSLLEPHAAKTAAYAYLQRLTRRSGTALRVVDKMPHNYLHLGLIATLLPRARIIHCRREPMDVCVAAYLQNFKWLPYTARMEDIGFYHNQYERLMDHWRQVLPVAVHEVVYEEMVANQEAVSRQLLAFCGLEWDERCLSFYHSQRPVQTASKLQVRQPIYTRSVARSKRFDNHLQPLREALRARP
jgi:Tfp pilus assembly protein PilF